MYLLTYSLPTTTPTFLPSSAHDETYSMNFQNGFATNILDKIIQHQDTRVPRKRIKKLQEDGNDAKDHLSTYAKFSASNYTKSGTNRLGKDDL